MMQEKARVLVVDDEESFCRVVERALTSHGCLVTVAHTGVAATNRVRESPFDLVFLDLRLPSIDGVETLREIRRLQPNVKVIGITGYAGDDRIEDMRRHGAVEVLQKPVPVAEIVAAVKRHLEPPEQPGATPDQSTGKE